MVGKHAQHRQDLLDKASAGDIDAAIRLDKSDGQRERRHRLRQQAAQGDERAREIIERDLHSRRRCIVEKAKRDQGDADAIARYEARKQRMDPERKQKVNYTATRRAVMKYGPGQPPPYSKQDAMGFGRGFGHQDNAGGVEHAEPASYLKMEMEDIAAEPDSLTVGMCSSAAETGSGEKRFGRENGEQKRGFEISELLNPELSDEDLLERKIDELRAKQLKLAKKKAQAERRLREIVVAMVETDLELERMGR